MCKIMVVEYELLNYFCFFKVFNIKHHWVIFLSSTIQTSIVCKYTGVSFFYYDSDIKIHLCVLHKIKIKLHYQHGRGGWGEKVINYLLRVLRDDSSNNDWGLNVWL